MDRILLTKILSSLVFILILYGVSKRNENIKHMKIMLTCFGLDLALVLFIELGKGAVTTAMGFPGGLLGFHIILSVLTITLYIWMIFTGYKLYTGSGDRNLHKMLAYIFLVLRATNLITSFFII
jgi:uncharacterized membrane protein YozB (DUF420 family)